MTISNNWKLVPIHTIFKESDERCNNKTYELLSVTQHNGIVKQSNIGIKKDTSNDDKSKYKIVLKNSIAYNKMRMWQGAVGINEISDGIVSPAYIVINPKQELSTKFYYYLFKTKYMILQFGRYSYGLCDDMNSLRYDNFKNIEVPFPPLSEQKTIASFLDNKCEKIENYITQKTKQITHLKELKTAIINECVAKGLDKTATFKESGIEWFGKIPSHWEVKKLKFVAKCIFSNVDKHTHENETNVLLCNYTDVYKNNIITKNINFMNATATEDEIKKFLLQKNDVIITKDSETPDDMAVPTFVAEDFNNVLCGYHLAIVRPKEKMVGKFLYYLFMSKNFNVRFEIYSNGVTRYGLGNYIVNNSKIPLPPIEEQKQIAIHIEQKLDIIDKLIQKTTKEIDFLKEYKTSLIDEVVSGKRKVKHKREANIQFKRAVLGAYIIDKNLDDNTFGRVKFQKILYMCEVVNNFDFKGDYKRHEMGPHSPKMLNSIETMIKKTQWFEAKKIEKRYKYFKLEKSDDYKKYIDRYYDISKIDKIINMFKKMNTQQSEIVATIYSAWRDLLKIKNEIKDGDILDEVLNNWHESKKKISRDKWLKAIDWMKKQNLVPRS